MQYICVFVLCTYTYTCVGVYAVDPASRHLRKLKPDSENMSEESIVSCLSLPYNPSRRLSLYLCLYRTGFVFVIVQIQSQKPGASYLPIYVDICIY